MSINTEQIKDLAATLEGESPQAILRYAHQTYRDQLAIVTSFQITGIVTLHMLREMTDAPLQVLTLDTGVLFAETYQLMERVAARFDVSIQRLQPEPEDIAAHDEALWLTDADQCCYIRKTKPLAHGLAPYSAWVTGLRRDQSPSRATTPVIGWDGRYNMVKFCPFAGWTQDMLWTYIRAHDLPYNALHDAGYPSIGCVPCTRPAADDDLRSGRWAGTAKTECGIHDNGDS
ncbi:MAG: phosphoadenylyl-sulfate reductase [Anaerolineaceae bacterium]|nr:MAG: phosphoadenylyl-sulfate reductase [Anaerolineaceae bacterium]